MNLNKIDITYISIAIGYTILVFLYSKYINYYDIDEPNTLVLIKTVFNVFIYMGILLTWFFSKQSAKTNNPVLLTTLGYAGGGLLVCGILLYVSFEGIEYIMEKGIENNYNTSQSTNDTSTPEKDYCPDVCNWFTTKDQCTTNKTWNGISCAWNASKALCSSPKPQEPWTRNIIRSIFALLTLVILLLLIFNKDNIVNIVNKYPKYKWILSILETIHNTIDAYKRDINITTSTTWILISIELFVLGLYFFSHYFAYRAYNKYGFIIQNPPLGINYRTVVGCETLNKIHKHQTENTSDSDSKGSITIEQGAITNFLPLPENIKENIISYNNGPIPKETYTLTTDLIVHRDKTTEKNPDTSGVNYNYGLSMWIYIDPHQPADGYDHWYSLFSFDSKPTLLYNPKGNALKLSMKENKVPNTKIKNNTKYSKPVKNIPLQKWNHIFINTIGSKTDLFLNGELVSNIVQAIPRNQTNKIITGTHNGIVGRICNIYYFKQSLYGTQILDIYHKYKNYDPPMAF